jgi:hypothetical protein
MQGGRLPDVVPPAHQGRGMKGSYTADDRPISGV